MWHMKQHFTDERLTSSVLSFGLSRLLTYALLSCGHHHSLNDCLLWRNAQSFEMCSHKPSLKHVILVSDGEGEAEEGEGK